MQQVLKQAIEQMVRLGNALNWNPPVDHEYVNAINELRALRDATQHGAESDEGDSADEEEFTNPYLLSGEELERTEALRRSR